MLLMLISVSLMNLIVSPVYGLITIESQPAKVVNENFVKLICYVGTMKNTVKWVYGGVTYFSCDPPYTNCFTNTSITNDDYYDFSVNNDSLSAIFHVKDKQNDGTWSCYHGNQKADIEIDNADRAWISWFLSPTRVMSGEYKIRCTLKKNPTPVDVLIYADGHKGTRILYDVKQSNLSQHSVSSSLLCSESIIYCNVTNGYGLPHSRNTDVSVECPLKILYNLSTTTFTLDDKNSWGEKGKAKIYYEGNPTPARSLYRIREDDIPESTEVIYPGVHEQTLAEPAYVYVYYDRPTVKAGRYILTLKLGNITEVVHLNIIKSTTTTTTSLPIGTSTIVTRETDNRTEYTNSPTKTALPIGTSTIDTRKTTSLAEERTTPTSENGMDKMESLRNTFVRKTKDETNIGEFMNIIYLGVAGFVISVMLILILVIVGVFWFIRIKRKPAGSVDPTKHPIIFTKT